MLELTRKITTADKDHQADTVSLPWEKRLKSRLRVTTSAGVEAGIFLPRGTVLRGGELLASEDGRLVQIVAAPESVSTVRATDPLLCARLCYHLGNRHVAIEIASGYIRYLRDHVLDDMVGRIGGTVEVEEAPFEPEYGAYSGGHTHGHDHG